MMYVIGNAFVLENLTCRFYKQKLQSFNNKVYEWSEFCLYFECINQEESLVDLVDYSNVHLP